MKTKRVAALAVTLLGLIFATTACTTTTPEAMCAFVVGDGESGHDTKLHRVVLPGDSLSDTSGEIPRFVPCNARNYKINDGSERVNMGGDKTQQVGDRFTPSLAYTKDGTPIHVWSNAYWTLNQTKQVLETFYDVCYKYSCFSTDNAAGGSNFSTPGWNGMLGENFAATVDQVAIAAAAEFGDDIWRKQDASLREKMATKMSELFAAAMQKKFGIAEDIFCGSGNSGWDKDHKTFNCTQVRFEVPRVHRFVPNANEAASTPESQQKLNEERLAVARALYGDSAVYWLGVMDSINACKQSGTPCQINIGSALGASGLPVK